EIAGENVPECVPEISRPTETENMPKQRTGYVYYDRERKTWTARLTYTDDLGRIRNIRRQVINRTEGKTLLKKLINDIEQGGPEVIDGAKLTFKKLAGIYRDEKLMPPVYEDGVRISGLRSYITERHRLATLEAHFGAKRAVAISYGDILKFKLKRLRDPNKHAKRKGIEAKLKIATVNRELQLLRGVLNFAKRRSWIIRNPFEFGEPLISMASEKKRNRILTRDEEARLLPACEVKSRKHL